jgi:transcriptional regulator with XRE-family HTH domain
MAYQVKTFSGPTPPLAGASADPVLRSDPALHSAPFGGPVLAELGERIRLYRKERQLSQAELGRLTSSHPRLISKYENGEAAPSVDKLKKIAEALHLSTDALVYDRAPDFDIKKTIRNVRLLEMFRIADRMDKKDQEAVMRLIDAMVAKKRLHELSERHQ